MGSDIENQLENKPGELGAIIYMTITALISFVIGTIYVVEVYYDSEEEGVVIWRPHRAVMGIVLISCLCTIACSPIGGIIEVLVTGQGTIKQAIKNSYMGAWGCLCSICD